MKKYFKVLRQSVDLFIKDNGLKLSASLSFYTMFSIGPALLIMLSLLGIFFGREAIEGRVFYQISSLLGDASARQIQEVIKNIELNNDKMTGLIIGGVILFIGATGVFIEMQDSLNYVWSVKAKPKRGWLRFLMNRLISFSLLISFGFVFLVSLGVNSALEALSERLLQLFPEALVIIAYIINLIITFGVVSLIFAFIFRFLPDAIIHWKDAWSGAFVTALLFMIGKFAIAFYISKAEMISAYGAAASAIILLSWVYYSSVILFFGAAYTRNRAIIVGRGVKLKENAVFIIRRESKEWDETDNSVSPAQKKSLTGSSA
jgi:membrane protein